MGTPVMRRNATALLAALWLIAYPAWAGDEQQVVAAVRRVKPAVVNLLTYRTTGTRGIGSGVMFTSDGWIITNAHVVRNANRIEVSTASGRKYNAVDYRISQDQDIAVVRVDSLLTPPPFGDSDALEAGQTAIAIGNPLRFSFTVTVGVISATGRDLTARNIHYHDLIQTDAAINPGNSGGALVNSQGEVIGINTLVYTGTGTAENAQGLSFAIPIKQAKAIALGLIKGAAGTRPPGKKTPWVGFSAITVTKDMARMYALPAASGVLVQAVEPGSPAALATLEPGDLIVAFNGVTVRSTEDFKAQLARLQPGTRTSVTLWRTGTKHTLSIAIGSTGVR